MPYATELAHVIEIVREAGAALRAELHRPGGPRGGGSHADIDEEIERFLRARLPHLAGSSCALTGPTWAYLGEETGAAKGEDGAHTWLVDPNDGTASFLKRRRGAAVSVGLLRAGRPVLGVVYSYAFPDDEGDLIAWAEGCGAVTRNGEPVEATLAARELTSRALVLVSQDADRRPVDNARLVSPARFAAMPSLAYRLALVAAGDADAAVSLAGPASWDYAAGHALLLGAGGELLDEQGRPVRYEPGGGGGARACFGGAPGVVGEISRRNWSSALSSPPADHRPYGLASLAPRELHAGPALARAQGCLLGQLAGDSLGSLVEFQGPERILARYPDGVRDLADGGTFNTIAGQPTDDSEMALVLARSVLLAGRYDASAALDGYVRWYDSGPFDIGGTTRAALFPASRAAPGPERLRAGAERANRESQANGSLMRASPLGVVGAFFTGDLAAVARADSALTHPHPICQEACAAFVVAIAAAIRGQLGPRACYEAALAQASLPGGSTEVRDRLIAAADAPPADYLHKQGWVLVALQNAFHQLLFAPSLEQGVVNTVMCGGDTDTNAAIAGALLGAVHGRAAVPPRWTREILSCRPLVIEGKWRPSHPRPSTFWPVDALELAEALLVAGASPAGSAA
jgi:ADP-ribosyl-[dinitrogen reductase] hydrolase